MPSRAAIAPAVLTTSAWPWITMPPAAAFSSPRSLRSSVPACSVTPPSAATRASRLSMRSALSVAAPAERSDARCWLSVPSAFSEIDSAWTSAPSSIGCAERADSAPLDKSVAPVSVSARASSASPPVPYCSMLAPWALKASAVIVNAAPLLARRAPSAVMVGACTAKPSPASSWPSCVADWEAVSDRLPAPATIAPSEVMPATVALPASPLSCGALTSTLPREASHPALRTPVLDCTVNDGVPLASASCA